MSSFQAVVDKSTELNNLTNGIVAQAASNLANGAEGLSHDELVRRLDGALRALRGDSPSSADVTKAQKTCVEIAEEMIDSYAFDKQTGVSRFVVPAGVTDVDAMKAINHYFRTNHSDFDRDAVFFGHLKMFEDLPTDHPKYCADRDYSQARQITIAAIVLGTKGVARIDQEGVLGGKSLVFSDPRDQALAAAIHACKHNGADLFKDSWVRGCVPGLALDTHGDSGIIVVKCPDGNRHIVAASGSPSRELK